MRDAARSSSSKTVCASPVFVVLLPSAALAVVFSIQQPFVRLKHGLRLRDFSLIVAESEEASVRSKAGSRGIAFLLSVMQNHRQRALLVLIFGELMAHRTVAFTCTCFLAVALHVAGRGLSWFVPALRRLCALPLALVASIFK